MVNQLILEPLFFTSISGSFTDLTDRIVGLFSDSDRLMAMVDGYSEKALVWMNNDRHLLVLAGALCVFLILSLCIRYYRKMSLKRSMREVKKQNEVERKKESEILEIKTRTKAQREKEIEIAKKVQEKDPAQVQKEEKDFLTRLILLMICRSEIEPGKNEYLEKILAEFNVGETAKEIKQTIENSRKKARPTDIAYHNSDMDSIESMLSEFSVLLKFLEKRVYTFLKREDIRYSTVGSFIDRVKHERRQLLALIPDFREVMEEINKSLDMIIYYQDHLIISKELTGKDSLPDDIVPADEAATRGIQASPDDRAGKLVESVESTEALVVNSEHETGSPEEIGLTSENKNTPDTETHVRMEKDDAARNMLDSDKTIDFYQASTITQAKAHVERILIKIADSLNLVRDQYGDLIETSGKTKA